MFTDNRHPEKGVMSAALGAISVVTLVCAGAFLAAIFSVTGLVLGIMSKFEKDIFKLFPNLGIILNTLSVAFVIFLILLGFGVI